PAGALECSLRTKDFGAVAQTPVEQNDRRVADAGEGVANIGDAGASQERAVSIEGHAANAAVVGAEGRVVAEQYGAIHGPHQFAGLQVPLADIAVKIGGNEVHALRMKGDVVDVAIVAFECSDKREIGGGPDLHQMIVAARGEPSAVGADGDRAAPAAVRVENAL